MTTFLSKDIREGLLAAQKLAQRRKSRFRVEDGGKNYPVLRLWDNGFAMEADAPRLRGLVDLFDGGRQMLQCLIVASEEENGEMRYDFKRATTAVDAAPLDFVRDENAPVGLIAPPM